MIRPPSGRPTIDLNADLGEGDPAADEALLAVVSRCNVACGGHAGDATMMRATVTAALARGVAIGAHPSFPDRPGFGRRMMAIGTGTLVASLRDQIEGLAAIAAAAGARLTHVKPHGALYHAVAVDRSLADAFAALVAAIDPALLLVGPSGSELLRAGARHGVATASEVFADRAYAADGSLVPRGRAGAIITDPAVAAARAVRMAIAGVVEVTGGGTVAVRADTIGIHADTPAAASLARGVRAALEAAGVAITASR
ncbi:MAG: 5-oxoprolinase subunit PxpA [Planctomycetaceae bacterium]